MVVVKQGDQYKLKARLTINGQKVSKDDIDVLEIYFGKTTRYLYPGTLELDDDFVYIPLTQEQTFGLSAKKPVEVDGRIKFKNGEVHGTKTKAVVTIADATSEEVL